MWDRRRRNWGNGEDGDDGDDKDDVDDRFMAAAASTFCLLGEEDLTLDLNCNKIPSTTRLTFLGLSGLYKPNAPAVAVSRQPSAVSQKSLV
jgi:hypothetical protein